MKSPPYIFHDRRGTHCEALIRAPQPWAYEITRFRVDLLGKMDSATQSPIGSIRRDRLDHVVIFDEQHPRHLLNCYKQHCNDSRAHQSLKKDAPIPRDAGG